MKTDRKVAKNSKRLVALTSTGAVALALGMVTPSANAAEPTLDKQAQAKNNSSCNEDEDGRWLIGYNGLKPWYVLPTTLTTCDEAHDVVVASMYSAAQREAGCASRTVFYPGKFQVNGEEWFCASWSPLSGTTVTYGTVDDGLMRFTIQRPY